MQKGLEHLRQGDRVIVYLLAQRCLLELVAQRMPM